jgi:thiamine transport system substrate-binding protein
MRAATRRAFLAGTGAAVTGLSGCLDTVGGSESDSDTLRVGTTQAYVDAVSTSAGEWVKSEFESRHDATLEWVVRENEVNDFIQRRKRGVPLEADAYVGVTPQDLVRARNVLGDRRLFAPFDRAKVQNVENVVDAYQFDPQDRVLPTGASYVCIVYDETEVEAPPDFEALTTGAYRDSLLLANPQSTVTGLSFLLWTVHAKGRDGYLDYWNRLLSNDVHVLGSWNDAYSAYLEKEAPMVVSYSTDQVYAAAQDQDMSRHQISFPNDQGYAYVSGTAKFATTGRDDLAQTFANFMLDPDVQRTVAVKNVGIPTVENASLPDDFQQYVHVPDEPVQYDYDVLGSNMSDWRDAWSKQAAKK